MLKLNPQCVFIEGPDLSGKTTLIRDLHRRTSYRYHLMDRSHISRDLFAKMYSRPTDPMMDLEINNLNNRYYILDPSAEIVRQRFAVRGDEIHDLDGVLRVREAFIDLQSTMLSNLPNLIFVPVVGDHDIAGFVANHLESSTKCTMMSVASEALCHANARGGETWGLSVTLHEDGGFEQVVESDRDPDFEVDYYKKISGTMLEKIRNEMEGINEYSRRETIYSRRFVFSDNSCISFIQVGIRDGKADFYVCIRSSNLVKTLHHDLNFLHRLCRDSQRFLLNKNVPTQIRIMINSAHVVP
jgi:hypothetical protein